VRAEAAARAAELARKTLTTIDARPGWTTRDGASAAFFDTTLKPFLVGTIEPSVLILVASAVVEPAQEPSEGWREQTYSREQILGELDKQPIDPWPLIAYVEQGAHKPPAVLFNLACFYSRVGDYIVAARLLRSAIRETPRPERKALVDVAVRDAALAPLRSRRPGIVPCIREMLDPPPPALPEDELAKRRFELQEQVHDSLERDGWTLRWQDDGGLRARRESDWLLVELADSRSYSSQDLDGTLHRLRTFRETQAPGAANVRARVIIPSGAGDPTVDLAAGPELAVEIQREKREGGFELLTPA
jgi:hypothetical protein